MIYLILTAQNLLSIIILEKLSYQIVFIKNIILFSNFVNYKYTFPEQMMNISIMYKVKIKFLEITNCVFMFTLCKTVKCIILKFERLFSSI